MAGKLNTFLKAVGKAVGLGEKNFVGDAAEHAAKVKPKPAAAQPKADPWAEVEHARSRQGGPAVDVSGPGLVPKGQEVPLGGKPAVDPSKILAPDLKLQEQHRPMGGNAHYPDPSEVRAPNLTLHDGTHTPPAKPVAAAPAAAPPRTPNYTVQPVEPPKTGRSAADDKWARAKAAVEGGDPFRTPAQGHGGLSLQQAATPAQLEREAMQRAQAAANAHSAERVSMSRLTEAQQRDQTWASARSAAEGRGPAAHEMVDFQRVDTSGLSIHNPELPARPGSGKPATKPGGPGH